MKTKEERAKNIDTKKYESLALKADSITISRKALEEWRDHYLKMADGLKKEPWGWGFYEGRAETSLIY